MTAPEHVESLVMLARQGDRLALGELLRLSRDGLLSFVESRIGEHLRVHLAPEDVVQEAFSRALQSLERFEWQGEGSFLRWVRKIAEHVILEAVRKQKNSPGPLDADVPDGAISPSRELRRRERLGRFEEALESLSPDHRRVIVLARIEKLKIREIAERMERSPAAVKQLLSRALKSLRDAFGDTESFHLPHGKPGDRGPGDATK